MIETLAERGNKENSHCPLRESEELAFKGGRV